ncbi:uncharacterized protein IL334_006851 [Kwoniella shivajii]|uniref:GTPase n=1 Tax=Kwoniella shivajii TaxID=564305 RepID=A0ABZ1D931_9TREE|nr:hypothetical protein IL334_006851 [Kwoniella shivajii]
MILLPSLRTACPRCHRLTTRLSSSTVYLRDIREYSTGESSNGEIASEHYEQDFTDIAGELKRRKRKADSKRRQYGNTFVDHILVTVRGGKGGSGAAALTASVRGPSAPSGGNGGSGGSVYLTTSPSLSSLTTLKKRVIGGQGASGSGSFKHGKRGEDVLITVPVGTVVRELKREGEEERTLREEDELGLNKEERRKRKWQRWLITHPSAGGEVSIEEYQDAENLLKKEGKWINKTPTFEQLSPIELDLDKPLNPKEPILLSLGGQGGLGNPFFNSPRLASKGFLPPTQTFEFELKLLSDVGLVGFPNSGKSTLLRSLTGRKAEIAGYEFTTLNPQIGVVRVFEDGNWSGSLGLNEKIEESWITREEEELARLLGDELPQPVSPLHQANGAKGKVERIRFTLSDNPGLLPLASQNVGLGHSFLRSIERSPVLIYVLDLTKPSPAEDLEVLKGELEAYKSGLSGRANIVVLNKGDGVNEEQGKFKVEQIRQRLGDNGDVVVVSGKYGLGVDRLVDLLVGRVERAREERKLEIEEKEKMKARGKRGGFGLRL